MGDKKMTKNCCAIPPRSHRSAAFSLQKSAPSIPRFCAHLATTTYWPPLPNPDPLPLWRGRGRTPTPRRYQQLGQTASSPQPSPPLGGERGKTSCARLGRSPSPPPKGERVGERGPMSGRGKMCPRSTPATDSTNSSSRRQEAHSWSARKSQSLLTSAATVHQETPHDFHHFWPYSFVGSR
jgi:hypothetical protein